MLYAYGGPHLHVHTRALWPQQLRRGGEPRQGRARVSCSGWAAREGTKPSLPHTPSPADGRRFLRPVLCARRRRHLRAEELPGQPGWAAACRPAGAQPPRYACPVPRACWAHARRSPPAPPCHRSLHGALPAGAAAAARLFAAACTPLLRPRLHPPIPKAWWAPRPSACWPRLSRPTPWRTWRRSWMLWTGPWWHGETWGRSCLWRRCGGCGGRGWVIKIGSGQGGLARAESCPWRRRVALNGLGQRRGDETHALLGALRSANSMGACSLGMAPGSCLFLHTQGVCQASVATGPPTLFPADPCRCHTGSRRLCRGAAGAASR